MGAGDGMTPHLVGRLPGSFFQLDNQPCGAILLETRMDVQEIFSFFRLSRQFPWLFFYRNLMEVQPRKRTGTVQAAGVQLNYMTLRSPFAGGLIPAIRVARLSVMSGLREL
jgi:hypothetical protein